MKPGILLTLTLALAIFPAFPHGECPELHKDLNPICQGKQNAIKFGDKTYKIGKIHGLPANETRGTGDVITSVEGTSKLYNKHSAGTFVLGDRMAQYMDDFPATIVWGNDDSVFIQDILSTVPTGNYVKGTISGNRINVAANQTLDYYEDEGYGINIGVLRTEINKDQVDFYYDPSIMEFSYIIDNDGGLSLDLPGRQFDGDLPPEYVIGIYYTDDNSFLGFCDYTQQYKLTELTQITMPVDANVEAYVLIDEFNYASLVDVAYVGDKLYIRGLTAMLPEGTIMANVEGNKAYVDQNEYMGIYFDQFFIMTKVLLDNPDYNEDDESSLPFIMAPSDMKFTLDIDKEAKTISATQDGVYLSFQPDEDTFENSITVLGKFDLKYQSTTSGVPANPTNLSYTTEFASRQGFNDFFFTLSNFSTEGNLLNTETLYYRIFIDDEPLIFGEEIGMNLLNEEVTMYYGVPGQQLYMVYPFNNNEDIFKFSENEFDIGIYVDGVTTIGIQAMYMNEGKQTFSDIVTLDVETGEVTEEAGVDNISISPIEKIEYYNISGTRVSHPDKGIYIIKEIRRDGKITTRKVAF